MINALKVVRKDISKIKIIISGSGAAGIAITKLLLAYGAKNIILLDSKGSIFEGRKEGMNWAKKEIAKKTNKKKIKGGLKDALVGSDVFIGVSAPNLLSATDVGTMNKNAIVFAMSNPVPEIMPEEAKKGGAAIVATGRSDFPNQINNVLVFPGIFRGALDTRTRFVTDKIKIKAAEAIAGLVKSPKSDKVVPEALDKRVVRAVKSVF